MEYILANAFGLAMLSAEYRPMVVPIKNAPVKCCCLCNIDRVHGGIHLRAYVLEDACGRRGLQVCFEGTLIKSRQPEWGFIRLLVQFQTQ